MLLDIAFLLEDRIPEAARYQAFGWFADVAQSFANA